MNCTLESRNECSNYTFNDIKALVWVWTWLLIISTLLNGFILFVTRVTKQARAPVNRFIVSLSTSDLFLTITLAVFLYTEEKDVYLGNYGARSREFFFHLFHAIAVFNLLAVCFERYYAVCKPIKFNNFKRKVNFVITATWIVSIAVSLPLLINCHLHTYRSCESDWCTAYSLCQIAILYLIPMFVFLYIIMPIRSQLWSSAPLNHTSLRIRNKQTKEVTKMIGIIILVSFLLWIPYGVLTTLKKLQVNLGSYECLLWFVVHLASFFRCCINPIIYLFYNAALKGGIKKLTVRSRRILHYSSDVSLSQEGARHENAKKNKRLSIVSQSCLQLADRSPTSLSPSYLPEDEISSCQWTAQRLKN